MSKIFYRVLIASSLGISLMYASGGPHGDEHEERQMGSAAQPNACLGGDPGDEHPDEQQC